MVTERIERTPAVEIAAYEASLLNLPGIQQYSTDAVSTIENPFRVLKPITPATMDSTEKAQEKEKAQLRQRVIVQLITHLTSLQTAKNQKIKQLLVPYSKVLGTLSKRFKDLKTAFKNFDDYMRTMFYYLDAKTLQHMIQRMYLLDQAFTRLGVSYDKIMVSLEQLTNSQLDNALNNELSILNDALSHPNSPMPVPELMSTSGADVIQANLGESALSNELLTSTMPSIKPSGDLQLDSYQQDLKGFQAGNQQILAFVQQIAMDFDLIQSKVRLLGELDTKQALMQASKDEDKASYQIEIALLEGKIQQIDQSLERSQAGMEQLLSS